MANDLEQLQGRWNVAMVEMDGERLDGAVAGEGGAHVVLSGRRFTSIGMGATYEGSIELDETRRPRSFDLVFTDGPEAGTRNLGIYELDGDRWTICLATRGSRRPRTFATRPGTGLALQTLERDRAGATPADTPKRKPRRAASGKEATPPQVVSSSGAATAIEGEWQMLSGVFDGAPMPANMVKWATRMTRGDVTTVVAGGKVILKARFTLDDPASPRTIEYANLEGSNRGKAQSGIVELRGDVLSVCMSRAGAPRPDAFESKKGDGRSYTTWRRIAR